MRLIGIISLFIFLTGCSGNFASFLQVGGTSVAIAQKNGYSIAYNAVDFGTQIQTGKNIRQHIFEPEEENEDE